MRFDIDYSRAKTMATRLQDYLSANPKPTLSRSSSIEAIAQILGFNNRNEMAARLQDVEILEAPASEAAPEATTLSSAREAVELFEDVLETEKHACAKALVKSGRDRGLEGDFMDAMHEDGDREVHALIEVEDQIASDLEDNPTRLRRLHAAIADSPEMEEAHKVRKGLAAICAMALVNESLAEAEELWAEGSNGVDDEPTHPPRAWLSYEVIASCWAPASLQVELPGGRIGEIAAQIICQATITVDSYSEAQALREVHQLIEADCQNFEWTPRTSLGAFNARWSGSAQAGDPKVFIARENDLVEDHWELHLDNGVEIFSLKPVETTDDD